MLRRLLSIALGEVPAQPVERLSSPVVPAQERLPPRGLLRAVPSPQRAGARPNRFAAVSIVPGRACCRASTGLGKQRFLTREAPLLPLQDCTASEQCQCRYQKHEDRRQPERRQALWIAPHSSMPVGDRRKQRGRRATDG